MTKLTIEQQIKILKTFKFLSKTNLNKQKLIPNWTLNIKK